MTQEIQTLSALVQSENIFACTGYSKVKVSYRSEDKAKGPCTMYKIVRVPIKTTGVMEYREKVAAAAPKPPTTTKLIKAGSDEADVFGINQDAEIIVFDTTDESYVEALNEHNNDFVLRVAVFAIDLQWVKNDGTTAKTYEEKRAILESNGICGIQLTTIYNDITKLAKFSEVNEDFLSES